MNSLSGRQSDAREGEASPQREEETMRAPTLMRACLMAGAAMFLFAPNFALAQTPQSRADLEARVKALEEALASVRAELDASKQRDVAADDKIVRVERQVAAIPAPVAPAAPVDGFKVGDATIKIGGFIKAEALVSDFKDGAPPAGLGRDFYLPSAIAVGAPAANQDFVTDLHAKQTRLWINATSPIGQIYAEGDFQTSPGTQASERTTNGTNFALRRAYFANGDWLFGQDWSTFQNVGALPETPDFIGPTEGTVFVRQVQARYTNKLSDTVNLQFAIENAEAASVTPASAGLVENDDDQFPDVVGRVNFKNDLGEFTIAGLARQLRVAAGSTSEDTLGWGLSASGKIKVGEQDDIRFMLTGGDGIGRYVGLNLAPDATDTATDFEAIGVLAGFIAYRHVWAKDLRSTAMYSFQNIDNTTGLVSTTSTDSAWSAAVNLFYTPVKGVDLGVEYRHAERELFNGLSGDLDRLHLVAKRTF